MDADTKWRQRTSANGGVRRSRAASAVQMAPTLPNTSIPSTRERPRAIQDQHPSNQPEERVVSPFIEAEDASSRWKEMRHSVRTKATLETSAGDHRQAKIADLCPLDREKVSNLARRIVEIGTLHEEAEKEWQRQKDVQEAEVDELRQHVRRDAEEIQELSDKVRTTKRKAQLYEERVAVLEESIDSETRSRLEAEQTLDLLKLEVEKLRGLVQRQQADMQRAASERQSHYEATLACVKEELKQAHELLLTERNERLLDKQRALDQRLERSAAAGEEKLNQLHSLLVEQQVDVQMKAKEQQEELLRKTKLQREQFELEMNQLKHELKVAQELLQERENQWLAKEKKFVDTIQSFKMTAQAEPYSAWDTSFASPVQQTSVFESDVQNSSFATDMQGDFAMFEEVKDLYAEDLFASQRWQAKARRLKGSPWQDY